MTRDDFDSWLKLIGLILMIFLCIWFFGCASVPSMSITEAEIDAKLEALSGTPKDPGAVVYNETESLYELRPDVYKRAVRDGVVKDIQDEKIAEMNDYLEKHPPMTFWRKVKHFGIGFVVGYLLGIGSGIYISQ